MEHNPALKLQNEIDDVFDVPSKDKATKKKKQKDFEM